MKKIFRSENFPIIALLILCFAIGIIVAKDYGESWDEPNIFIYANYSFQAYQHILHPQDLQLFSGDLNYYGPAYFMLAQCLIQYDQTIGSIPFGDHSLASCLLFHVSSMCLDVVFIIETLDELVGGIWRGASVHVPAADVGTFLYQSQGYSLYDVFSRQHLFRS